MRGAGSALRRLGEQITDDVALSVARVVAWVVALGYLVLFCLEMTYGSYNEWLPFLLIPLLIALTVPLAVREGRRSVDRLIPALILWAVVLKLGGALVRYLVAFGVYEGGADASVYDQAGTGFAELFREGYLTVDVGGPLVGTNFIKVLTGIVYTLIGSSKLGGFLVFSWLGFLGLYLMYRAFRTAVPDGHHRRYAVLAFFLPSLLFWPSSIGKEAWMMLTLGISAYGVARVYARQRGGYLILSIGLVGMSMVRPHVAVVVVVAVVAGLLLRRSPGRPLETRVLATLLGLVLLVVAGSVVVAGSEKFFGVDRFDAETVQGVLDKTEEQTAQGGSRFAAPSARSVEDVPVAAFSVLFRPFPFEARQAGELIASAEGTLLAVLCLVWWRQLVAVPRQALRRPYVTFCVVYSLIFVVAFSSFGNFGIITRQRVQVFPFVLALLCLPLPARGWRRPKGGRNAEEPLSGRSLDAAGQQEALPRSSAAL